MSIDNLSQSKARPKAPKQPTAAQLTGGLIISVGEARKVIGEDAKGLTDDELIMKIYELTELAQKLLNYNGFAR
jgi:hypothetical protein